MQKFREKKVRGRQIVNYDLIKLLMLSSQTNILSLNSCSRKNALFREKV